MFKMNERLDSPKNLRECIIKKKLTLIVFVILLAFVGFLSFYFIFYLNYEGMNNDLLDKGSVDSDEIDVYEGSIKLEEPSLDYNQITQNSIETFDKAGCNEIKEDYFRDNCLNGVDLAKRAIEQNDFNICFDQTIFVELKTRLFCVRQFEVKNE